VLDVKIASSTKTKPYTHVRSAIGTIGELDPCKSVDWGGFVLVNAQCRNFGIRQA
jgi:hypothetical protein